MSRALTGLRLLLAGALVIAAARSLRRVHDFTPAEYPGRPPDFGSYYAAHRARQRRLGVADPEERGREEGRLVRDQIRELDALYEMR